LNMADWFRALLRRLGIGERRWIPTPEEREVHTEVVRERLAHDPASEPPDVATDDAPGPSAGT
jgi:hypothetical protein